MAAGPDGRAACTDGGRVLNVGFYAFFAPVSYSADDGLRRPTAFHVRIAATRRTCSARWRLWKNAGLTFSRRGIAVNGTAFGYVARRP